MKLFPFICLLFLFYCCTKEDFDANSKSFSTEKKQFKDSSWKLIWSDEFNYTGLPDSNKWTYETGFTRNDEPQFYVAGKKANSKVAGGFLKINALYDSTNQHTITSASVTTNGKMNFLYGRIEARIKMPTGSGAWPAFWLEGINRDTVHWPFCGEIDIMEWLAQFPQYVLGSLYTINNNASSDTSQVTAYNPKDFPTLSSKFHVYAIEWDSISISYFYDNIKYAEYQKQNFTDQQWQPFTKPMYLILNLAIGQNGGTIDYSKFPFTYQVDYVRYYIKK